MKLVGGAGLEPARRGNCAIACSDTTQWHVYRFAIPLMLIISGCATTQPVPKAIYVKVPIPCIEKDKVPVAPMLRTGAELSKLNDYDLVLAINVQRLEVEQYAKELAAILIACVK